MSEISFYSEKSNPTCAADFGCGDVVCCQNFSLKWRQLHAVTDSILSQDNMYCRSGDVVCYWFSKFYAEVATVACCSETAYWVKITRFILQKWRRQQGRRCIDVLANKKLWSFCLLWWRHLIVCVKYIRGETVCTEYWQLFWEMATVAMHYSQ